MQLASRPRLKHVLLGPSRPNALVALFHGLGGSLAELRPMADRWRSALPTTGFLLMEAPDRDYFERHLKNGAWSGDWYKFPRLRSSFGVDEDAYTQMVTDCISDRCTHVSMELDRHLAELRLDDDRLVLVGFSQGAAISAYTGLRRHCLGVMPLGGPCPPRAELLPEPNQVTTQICAIVGDADHCAPHAEIKECFERYPGAHVHEAAGVHVVPNMPHVVSEASIELGLRFLRRCLESVPARVNLEEPGARVPVNVAAAAGACERERDSS